MKKFFLFSLVIFFACEKDEKPQPTPISEPKFCWTCTEELSTSKTIYDQCNMTEYQMQKYIAEGAHLVPGATINCVKKQ